MPFIKLEVNQQEEAQLITPQPTKNDGQYGVQLFYTFNVKGEESTLALTERSPANNDIQAMAAGTSVIIKKVPTKSGHTVYVVTEKGDITNTIPAGTPGPTPSQDEQAAYKQKEYQDKEEAKQQLIMKQLSVKAACTLRSGQTFELKDVLKEADTIHKWLNGLELPF